MPRDTDDHDTDDTPRSPWSVPNGRQPPVTDLTDLADELPDHELSHTAAKPGALLERAAAASAQNPHIIIAESDATARQAHELLAHPCQKTVRGLELYTTSRPVTDSDESVAVVLRDEADVPRWYLTNEGLELRCEGDCLADVDAAEELTPTTLGTSTADQTIDDEEEMTWAVESSDSERVEYPTRKALHEEWTELREPFIPTRLHYLEHTTVYVPKDGALVPYEPDESWDDGKTSRRIERLAEMFLKRYTVASEGTRLPMDEFASALETYHEAVSDKKCPGPVWLGRALPITGFDLDIQQIEGRTYLIDRTWRNPLVETHA